MHPEIIQFLGDLLLFAVRRGFLPDLCPFRA
jgi:hypothetical protein